MQIREYVKKNFDADYLPKTPNFYKTKAKNAQEAHEAVRPTDVTRAPAKMRQYLNDEQFKLYELIWKRTVACQMTPAVFDAVSVDLSVGSEANLFRASGQTLVFPGFIGVYKEGTDSAVDDDAEAKLPRLETGEILDVDKIHGEQHFTEPPPRYGEASLVKTLEEYGIAAPLDPIADKEALLDEKRIVKCTNCGSQNTKLVSQFGSTACKALFKCDDCQEPFDYFKCLK